MPHEGRVSNYIQLTNVTPWLMLNHDIEIREVGGVCQRSPASNSSPSPYPFSREQLPAICQYWKALVACSRFFQTYIHGCLSLSDSAVHKPSAVTSHWAWKRCQPSQSLIDTHEKSLLVVLLTQDIIKCWAVHWPEKDTVKLRKHYRQWSHFNVIGWCLPKCYLIACSSLNLSHNCVPQTNMPRHWQVSLLVIHGFICFVYPLIVFRAMLKASRKYILSGNVWV